MSSPLIKGSRNKPFVIAAGIPGPRGIPGPGQAAEKDPAFTYSAGLLSRIDYAIGAHKLFTYTAAGVLTQLDYVVGAVTTRKTFAYNPDGTLAAITQEVL